MIAATSGQPDLHNYLEEVSEIEMSLKKKNHHQTLIKSIEPIREKLIKIAERGIGKAYYLLGKISQYGIGIQADTRIAKLFYELGENLNDPASLRAKALLLPSSEKFTIKNNLIEAAQLGDKKACVILGDLYKDAKKYSDAERYYRMAYEKGSAVGAYELWKLKQQDLSLLEFAANKGHTKAIEKLLTYPIDDTLRIQYLTILAHNGQNIAWWKIGQFYEDRNEYYEAYTYYVIALEKNGDNIEILLDLAKLLEKRFGYKKYLLEARKLYEKAIIKENHRWYAVIRYIILSDKLDLNLEIPVDIQALERVALIEEPGAAYAVSIYYGSIFESDLEKAVKFLYLAADQKDPQALYDLGRITRSGSNMIPKDIIASMAWLKSAGSEGYAKAFYVLASIYRGNELSSPDEEKATEYFEKAINMGYDPELYDSSSSEEEVFLNEDVDF